MQSKVDLFLPFKDFVHRRVLVHGRLDGATLNRTGSTVMATDLNGDFDIDGAQVARAEVRGRVLGGTFQMQARAPRNRPVTRTQLDFRGTLTGEGLRTAMSLPAGISIGGQADWRGVLKMAPEPNRERSLRLSSTLAGLEIKLPAPLDKAADTPMPSWIDLQWPAGGGAQARVGLGSVVSGSFALDPDSKDMRLSRLVLTFGGGDSGSSDAQMINVGGSVGRLDLAGWLRLKPAEKNAKALSETCPWIWPPRPAACGLPCQGRMWWAPSRPSPRIRPSRGICNSTGCILTSQPAPNRRKAPPRPARRAVRIRVQSRRSTFTPRTSNGASGRSATCRRRW
jgi:uncharacterized protein YhdP